MAKIRGTTHFIHDIFGNVIAETAGNGPTGATGTVKEYIWIPETQIAPTMGSRTVVDRPIAVVNAVNTVSPVMWWVSVDHLHRPIKMTDAAKLAVWTAVWTPWGTPQSLTGTATLDARFPGQWYQMEAGLHYNWNRSYDPSLGRYTQPDPLGFVDGPSVYGYGKLRPSVIVDVLGLMDHHYVPEALTRALPLPPETAEVFHRSTLDVGPHGWSKSHLQYNKTVTNMFSEYCATNKIDPRSMTPPQANDFVNTIARSTDPVIRNIISPNINTRPENLLEGSSDGSVPLGGGSGGGGGKGPKLTPNL